MTALILMYVYFDKKGDIKAITPREDSSFSADYSYAMMPVADVESFLVGKHNPFDYTVKKNQKLGGPAYVISKKVSVVNLVRSIDNYVTKISETEKSPIIRIIVNARNHTVSIALTDGFKDLYENGSVEEQESVIEFLESGLSTVYLTRKNNPYSLLYNITFSPKELFDRGRMSFNCPETLDLRNSSAYTKRLVNSYRYLIKD